MRVISLQADAWYGVEARKNVVIRLNLSKWGIDASLAELSALLVRAARPRRAHAGAFDSSPPFSTVYMS